MSTFLPRTGRLGASGAAREWQVRLLGGALAALASAGAAIVAIPTLIGPFFGVVGIPVGGVLGLCYGPQLLLGERRDEEAERTVARLATTLGTVAVGIGFAVQQSRGASLPEVSELAFVATALLGVLSLPLGYPFARFVVQSGSRSGRSLAPAARLLWFPALVVLILVAVGTASVAGSLFQPTGFAAVQNGDRVPLRYLVRADRAEPNRTLELRSFADGEVALLDGAGIGDLCDSGEASVLHSWWMPYLVDDGRWSYSEDSPSGHLLVNSSQWTGTRRSS